MIFSGKMLTSQQAMAWGIVNEIFPPEMLMQKTIEMAKLIAKNGLIALAHAKKAIVDGINMVKEDGLRYEGSMFGLLFATEDQKEGMQAFLEKRAADFKNK